MCSSLVSWEWNDSWGKIGNGNGEFACPVAIAAALNGDIYVSDFNNRIQCFTASGEFVRAWGRGGGGDGEFAVCSGLAIGPWKIMNQRRTSAMRAVPVLLALPPGLLPICEAYMYEECLVATERQNHRIQVFQTDGTFVRKWGARGIVNGYFREPVGCAIDKEGVVYVADTLNSRVQVFCLEGTFIRKWNVFPVNPLNFTLPMSIAVSSNGVVYVTDSNTGDILSYSREGTYLGPIWSHFDHKGIYHIALSDQEKMIYACDTQADCVRLYGIHEKWNMMFGKYNSFLDKRKLRGPTAIIQVGDRLYVSDSGNHRIVIFRA